LKNYKDLPALGAPPSDPLASGGGEASRPPMVSGSWGIRSQTPTNPLFIQKSWLRHLSSPIQHIYPISMSLFCLSHSFVYLLYFCSSWDRS